MNRNKQIHVIYVDFVKAFDSVRHWAIVFALKAFNFGQEFIDTIMCLFQDTTCQIHTCHGLTSKISLNCGVKQRDVISPTLFILFLGPLLWKLINENFGYEINNIKYCCLAFADDIVLIDDDKEKISKSWQIVQKFSKDFQIDINPKKSAYAWNFSDPVLGLKTTKDQTVICLPKDSTDT